MAGRDAKKGDFLTENVTSVTFGVTFVTFHGILHSLKNLFLDP